MRFLQNYLVREFMTLWKMLSAPADQVGFRSKLGIDHALAVSETMIGKSMSFYPRIFVRLQQQAAVRGDRLTAYTPTRLQLREREGSRAQRQAAGACRGGELHHTLEWRSVALVGMQRGRPSPS